MFFKSGKVIGLDIGNSLMKVAELDVSRSGATLVSFGWAPTPPGVMQLGEVTNPDSLGASIGELVSQLNSKRKAVAVGIWGTAVFVKKISGIPIVDARVLGDQVRFEAEQINPFGSMDAVNFDYHVLKRLGTGSGDGQSVLVVIAQKDFIFKYAEVVNIAGLQCSHVDVTGFALANCFEFNYGIKKDQTIALLNIGAEVSNFVVLQNGEIVLSKDLPTGGLNYTNEIHRSMGVSLQEAEDLKLAFCTGQSTPPEIMEIINATHEIVVDTIRGAFDFYSQTGGDTQIQKIYVTGGSLGVTGLPQRLSEVLGIPFDILNPFARVKPGPGLSAEYISQVAPYAAIVVGLSLRKPGDS